MNFSFMLVLIALWNLWTAQAWSCDILEKYSRQPDFQLTDGTAIPVPTISKNFDSYSLYGFLDFTKSSELLKKDGVTPLNVGGHAFGVLSVYDYKNSDMGSFREAYFVILARKVHSSKIELFHVRAWSNSPQARLASIEIWGIPSDMVKIEDLGKNNFKVSSGEGSPLLELQLSEAQSFSVPLNQELTANALGPIVDGKQKSSPVTACRHISLSHFSKASGDRLLIHDLKLRDFFYTLNFKPVLKEIGRDQQAVQYLPQ